MTLTLTVHRGTRAIGGSCIELVAPGGERLILDAGRPLDASREATGLLPPTLDLTAPATVLFSHAHMDHWGLIDELPAHWPVWAGSRAAALMRLSAGLFGGRLDRPIATWTSRSKPFAVGPFTVTPYLTDHSAPDAYMLLVEAVGARMLYTGDFRAHGRKARLVEAMIAAPPPAIDVLVMEGTNLGQHKPVMTEAALEDRFVDLARATPRHVFVQWSAQNVDRTVTLYRAGKRTGRALVVDLYGADVLQRIATGTRLPRPGPVFPDLKVLITPGGKRLYARQGREAWVDAMATSPFATSRARLKRPAIIMLRDSMLRAWRVAGSASPPVTPMPFPAGAGISTPMIRRPAGRGRRRRAPRPSGCIRRAMPAPPISPASPPPWRRARWCPSTASPGTIRASRCRRSAAWPMAKHWRYRPADRYRCLCAADPRRSVVVQQQSGRTRRMTDHPASGAQPVIAPPATVGVHRPSPALEPYVTFYYFVTTTRPITDFLYPEWGNVRLSLDGEWQVAVDGCYDRVPGPSLLFGPTDRRSLVTASPGRMIGFGLTPIGWHRLIGGDCARMANAVRPLGDALGIGVESLRAGMIADGDDEAASVRRWETILHGLLASRPPGHPRVLAVDRALRGTPDDVRAFARAMALSERSLHRLCLDTFGFAPKRLLRRQRFLRTLGRVRAAVGAPVTPSLGEDYYDLPQFYRDFRDFMGMSARDYFAAPRDLMGPAAAAQQRAGVTLSFALAPPPAA